MDDPIEGQTTPDAAADAIHGGECLLRAVLAEGCDYVFGIPGGEFITFLEAVDRREHEVGDIHYIGVRHEQAGANMADAYSRVSGKIGICTGTIGPGFANLVPGVAPAFFDNIPILVVHPQMHPKFEEHHRLQDGINQMAVLQPIVKFQKSITDPNRIIWGAQKAFKAMRSGRPGPAQLEIREDAFHGQVVEEFGKKALSPAQYRCVNPPAGNPDDIEQAVKLLLAAKQPVIVSGGGVTSSNGWTALQKLSLTYRIPVMTTVMGIGTMSTNHETYIGATLGNGAAMEAARNGDVVLALGTKFSYVMGYGKPPIWNPDAKVIQVDLDPQMIGKNRPVDIGIIGDCRVVLEQLNKKLEENKAALDISAFNQWVEKLQKSRQIAIDSERRNMESAKSPIHPLRLIKELTSFLNPEDIICTDGGDITVELTAHVDYYKPRAPRTYLTSIAFGHIGVGIPFAIGAKLAKPNARVVCLSGDGSVMFNLQEWDTAKRHNIPFVTVVADNQCWGMIKNMEKRTFKKRDAFCVDLLEGSDIVEVAKGFGCYAERVDNPDDLKNAFQRAFDAKRPALLHVPIQMVAPMGTRLAASFKNMKF